MTYFPNTKKLKDAPALPCKYCTEISNAIAFCLDISGTVPPVGMIAEMLNYPESRVREHYQLFSRNNWLTPTSFEVRN